jgi:trehalose 6-phosphate phosphatase
VTTRWASQVEILALEPSATVVCCDFDGTIADIVDDPQMAQARPEALRALVTLATRFLSVAVISGRPAGFLQTTLGNNVAAVVHLFGRYGAERLTSDGAVSALGVTPEIRRQFATIAEEARLVAPGVRVEDKEGSLGLHWREAPSVGERLLELSQSEAAAGLEVRPGRQMVDLVVPGAPTKGTTLAALLSNGARRGCFLGDDVGDLEAFDALDAFERSGGIAVRVAVASAEMPAALGDRADLILGDTGEAAEFLSDLAASSGPH